MKEVARVLTAVFALSAGLLGCGDDSDPDETIDEPTSQRDAQVSSKRDAAVKDAARAKDAADTEVLSDADVEQDPDPVVEDDAATSPADKDAGPAKDAGGKQDAATADAGRRPDAGATSSDAGTGVCDQLTYATFGQQFMTNYCVSCHGSVLAQKNIHLDTLAGVTSAKGKVKSEVNGNSMPPFGSKAPSSAERKQLAQWIDCGPK